MSDPANENTRLGEHAKALLPSGVATLLVSIFATIHGGPALAAAVWVPFLLTGATGLRSQRREEAQRAEAERALAALRDDMRQAVDDLRGGLGEVVAQTGSLSQTSRAVAADASRQLEEVSETVTAFGLISESAGLADDAVKRLSEGAQEAAGSVSALDGSIWEIAESTEVLRNTMEEAGSATIEMTASIRQIAEGAERLGESSQATRESLARLDESIHSVESNAAETHRVSEDALGHARAGIEKVTEFQTGMREIDESFHNVQATIDRLAERSRSIDEIVSLIDEVVSRTHLLALNASIIAAQAGEQGRAFSVVAGEVRELADLTSRSTKEIADHVAAVRSQVDEAVEVVEIGAARLATGRKLSVETGESLRQIHEGSERATGMTRLIADATELQTTELGAVQTAMNDMNALVEQITRATREQSMASGAVLTGLDQMRDLCETLTRSCASQANESRQITGSASSLAESVEEIRGVVSFQKDQSNRILEHLQIIEEISAAGVERSKALSASTTAFERTAGSLQARAQGMSEA